MRPERLPDYMLTAIAASRYGLTERELTHYLSTCPSARAHVEEHRETFEMPEHAGGTWRLPAILWSRLWLDLGAYRLERQHPDGTLPRPAPPGGP